MTNYLNILWNDILELQQSNCHVFPYPQLFNIEINEESLSFKPGHAIDFRIQEHIRELYEVYRNLPVFNPDDHPEVKQWLAVKGLLD